MMRKRDVDLAVGRPAYYRPKTTYKTIGLTDVGNKLLRGTVRRCERSAGDVVDQLLRRFSALVAFPPPEER